MSKLLSANAIRLKKDRFFWIGMIFMLAAGISFPIMKYIDMRQTQIINHIDNGFFVCALFISIVMAVFCSLFIGTEYSKYSNVCDVFHSASFYRNTAAWFFWNEYENGFAICNNRIYACNCIYIDFYFNFDAKSQQSSYSDYLYFISVSVFNNWGTIK